MFWEASPSHGLGAVVWLECCPNWDVSKAYPWLDLSVFTVIIGYFLGEQVTPLRVIGVATDLCGGILWAKLEQ